jgi:hypothetical protein
MKKILWIVALLATAFLQNAFAQDSTTQKQLFKSLTTYYNIKNALVAGNANTAAINAEQLVKTLNGIDYKVISEGNNTALVKDAGKISEASDINKMREYFANLSINMIAIVKALKLSDQPVYEVYCPMKKAYWLSNEKAIKNPYFGNSMLTCGQVTQTFQ